MPNLSIVDKKLTIDTLSFTFIYFYRDTCMHCKNLKPSLDKISLEYKNLVFYAVDTSKNSDFIKSTKTCDTTINFIPYIIAFNNGVVVEKLSKANFVNIKALIQNFLL